MTNLEELQAMRAELWRLEGRTVIQEMNALARTLKVFYGNARELRRALGKLDDPPVDVQILALTDKEGFERFLDEVDRLLHNFVASAISLRDHTERIRRKFLPPADDDLADLYERRVRQVFADAPVARFVTELRNYTMHARLPIARGHFHMDMAETSFDATIHLDAEDLLRRGKWSASARAFIEGWEGMMPVDDVVTEYSALVSDSQDWFRGALEARNREAIDEFNRRQEEVARSWQAAWGAPPVSPPGT
jgi:hypothetical protein